MKCDFSLKHYGECLTLAKQKGYKFLTFNEYDQKEKYNKVIFMRHDVDLQIDVALKMAKIENKMGIKSTFFIRLHGNYNLFHVSTYRKFVEIKNMGHEIGLHFEPDFSSITKRNIIKDIKFSIKTLEHLFSCKINSICPHEPVRTGNLKIDDKAFKELGVKYHAYHDMFTKDMKYISDSSCRWREGCMHLFIEKETPRLCILTHPLWWFEDSPIENY